MDFASLKLQELRSELTARGLPTVGIKAVLVERLRSFEAEKELSLNSRFSDFDDVTQARLRGVDHSGLGDLGTAMVGIPDALLAFTKNAPEDPSSLVQQHLALTDATNRITSSLSIHKKIKRANNQSSINEAIATFYESIVNAALSKRPPVDSLAEFTELLTDLSGTSRALAPLGSAAQHGATHAVLAALPPEVLNSIIEAVNKGTLGHFLNGTQVPEGISAAAATAETRRKSEISKRVKEAVIAAFAPPPSGAGTRTARPIADERKIAQALVDGFLAPGTSLQPPQLPSPIAALRLAVYNVVVEACVARGDNDDAISLLPAFLAARAYLAVDAVASTVVPCQWDAFVANSSVGDASVAATSSVDRALAIFETVGWLDPVTNASTSSHRGPAIAIIDDPSVTEVSSAPTLLRQAVGGNAPHPGSIQRESPLTGKSGKEWRDFVKSLSAKPGWACGQYLVSGGPSELGARLSAAHTAYSSARDSLMGATTIGLTDIPFGGYTTLPYEATRVGDWAKLPKAEMCSVIENSLRSPRGGTDAVTGANSSIVANVLAAMVVKGKHIGLGHDSESGAFFADSSRFEDLPEDSTGFASWWRKYVANEVAITLSRMLASDRPACTLAPPPGAVNPCVVLAEVFGEALLHTLLELASIFPGVREQWLLSLLIAIFFVDGVIHCRAHEALVTALTPLATAAQSATSAAHLPQWYNYKMMRDSVVPPGWPHSQQLRPTTATTPDTTSLVSPPVHSRERGRHRTQKAKPAVPSKRVTGPPTSAQPPTTPLELPWIVRNPGVVRDRETCLYCGTKHSTTSCTAYTAYLATPIGSTFKSKLSIGNFPLGKSYSQLK